jgi:putative sterol carrier protein
MTEYVEDVKKYAASCDEDAVAGIVKHCGIALRSKDSSMVSCTQKPELDRVRDNFLKKKLELTDGDDALEAAIDEVCEKLGRSNKNKSRVTFYYLLAEKYGKLDLFK